MSINWATQLENETSNRSVFRYAARPGLLPASPRPGLFPAAGPALIPAGATPAGVTLAGPAAGLAPSPVSMGAAPFPAGAGMSAAPFRASAGGGAGLVGRPGTSPSPGRRWLVLGLAGAAIVVAGLIAGLLWSRAMSPSSPSSHASLPGQKLLPGR